MTQALHRRDTCRLCGSRQVELVLPIAASPIADAYIPAAKLGQPQDLYPLDLYLCLDCGHVQNLDFVDPSLLFRDYLFTTSSSAGLVTHFQKYAADVIDTLGVPAGAFVLEMGSNDGSLLRAFQERGMRVLGVDPARDIAAAATASGVETIPEFFDVELARRIRDRYGPAAVFAANNVFAHMDDLTGALRGVREALADDGVFVFEVSYLLDIVDRFLFDTVYHEHVSYHSIAPLRLFMERFGMQLIDVQRIASKGGSIRCFAQRAEGRRPVQPIVEELTALEERRGLARPEIFRDYARRIDERKQRLAAVLEPHIAAGHLVAGYGASTTTTTLTWHFGLSRKLALVVDDNPRKQGLYAPACHVPVVPSEELYVRRPEVTVILAWVYAEPIIARHGRYVAEGGTFVVPLPELRIVGAGGTGGA